MQFTLRDLLLLCVVLASALATFQIFLGIIFFILILLLFSRRRSTSREAKQLLLLLSVVWGIFCFFVLFPVCPPGASYAARKAACTNNLRLIGAALLDYQNANLHLPLARTQDAKGNPLHSWRMLILPALGEDSLYKQLDSNKPWNDPSNKKPLSTPLSVYACPSAGRRPAPQITNYVAITGPDTLWPEDRHFILNRIPDGVSNTILAIELAQSDISWGEPRDLSLKEMEVLLNSDDPEKIFSWHGYDDDGFYLCKGWGLNVLFADGTVRFCTKGALRKHLKALVTPNGGEKVTADDVESECEEEQRRLNWPWIISHGLSLLIFLASTSLLLGLPVKKRPQSTTPDHTDQAGNHDPLSD